MPITEEQIAVASALQHTAAHDPSSRVRLVASPGTGKSFAIEERVCWLLSQQVDPTAICVCSFTRAAALDLRRRVHAYCAEHGHATADQVRVSTLHSLALRTLRTAGMLGAYPADPLVLDNWEVEEVFDAEFGHSHSFGKKRREAIRRDYEAFWSTGQWDPPNHIPPEPPVSQEERATFSVFHQERTQAYSCVLPGELVRQCVDAMEAGNLDPVALLDMMHLIVDEYQDLNPVDLRFVQLLSELGATVFVAGDDDQSVYAFRFASPAGIQQFVDGHADTGDHMLQHCFRCTPSVLSAGQAVITANPLPNRIPKQSVSLYADSAPPLAGVVHRWRFGTGVAEVAAVSCSCRRLLDAGLDPRQVLILLSYPRVQGPDLLKHLEQAGVPYEYCRQESMRDTGAGRLALALLRVACSPDDYVAHRTILGARQNVGIGTCSSVCDAVVTHNLNFREVFYQQPLQDVFTGRRRTALAAARDVCREIGEWQPEDTLDERGGRIAQIIGEALGDGAVGVWQDYSAPLPQEITLAELRDLVWSETDDQRSSVLEAVLTRLGQPVPDGGPLPAKVRVMTMHGAKGLSACAVFIPGLEEELLPGPWRRLRPGLVLEAARLLYVSVTRARAACFVSYAARRFMNGAPHRQTPSRFANQLGGPFAPGGTGLSAAEAEAIAHSCTLL